MRLKSLLEKAYEQIITGCDLGDESRNKWLNDYEEVRAMGLMWINGGGDVIVPEAETMPDARLSVYSDVQLVEELKRRAGSRVGYNPLILLESDCVEHDTIVDDTA